MAAISGVAVSGLVVSLVGPQAFAGTVAISGVSSYTPDSDNYSMHAETTESGAPAWWGAGYTGQGVDVAVIDTGVNTVPGLATAGKVIYGPDLALDARDPTTRNLDENGHGTFMAGLIAGHSSDLTQPYGSAPETEYAGMAPDARIVSLKVGVADGEVDVSQVIAAIDWVTAHHNSNGMHIRVISLSYGTNSTQAEGVDPLAYAVEQAWDQGIVVVTPAGNTGFQQGTGAPGLADPGYDPYVITVGGYDPMGSYDRSNAAMGSYSASSAGCSSCKAPDLLAIGSHLQGLRVPGSYIDDNHPGGRLGALYFRGSGTSEATAMTAGAVALVLSKYPDLTPDQVKAYLTTNALRMADPPSSAQGAGQLNLWAMAYDSPPGATASLQSYPAATGTGSLEASRGSDHVDLNGHALTGAIDVHFMPFLSSNVARAEANDTTWQGPFWDGGLFTGALAYGYPTWPGMASYNQVLPTGQTWDGASWTGASWSGASWSGASWTGASWSGASWSSASWN